MKTDPSCPLCAAGAGDALWRNGELRVILPDEPDYPGFVRVIWNAHEAEMTDLPAQARVRLMDVVWTVERVVREHLAPDKVNVASLGNMVPHVHWHVIPRWRDDRHFPASVWSAPVSGRDDAIARRRDAAASHVSALGVALCRALDDAFPGARGGAVAGQGIAAGIPPVKGAVR